MAGRPRLLVLTPDFPPGRGGIQLMVERIIRGLRSMDVRIVTRRPRVSAASAADDGHGAAVVRVAEVPLVGRAGGMVPLGAVSLIDAVRFHPHVVLSAHVVTAPAAVLIRGALGVPFVQVTHGVELTVRPWLVRLAVKHADAVVSVSRHTESLVRALAVPRDLVLVPLGADPPPSRRRARSTTPMIVTVGRLDELYKGHDVLLRALPLVRSRVPDVRLVIVGDGVQRTAYERLAHSIGVIDSVDFVGAVGDDERDAWLDRAHVFCLVSRLTCRGGGEGFGIVYLEAAGHGLPVVAGRAGGAVEAVDDGVTGVLVDPDDHVAVAGALADLLLDPRRRHEMGRAGMSRAVARPWEHVAADIEALLLRVARR